MNENQNKTEKKSNNKVLVALIILLALIAILSAVIFMSNHKRLPDLINPDISKEKVKPEDDKAAKSEDNKSGDLCVTITDEMLQKSINEYKDFGKLTINDGPVFGLKEVVVQRSGEVFYSNCDGSLLFVGAVIDKTGRNLTKESMDKAVKEIFSEKTKNIDKSLAVKMGNGEHELIVFTDPDCPYCRAAEAMFAAKPLNATRYVFFTPLDAIHPEAAKKAIHVLCSANPGEELVKVIKNEITEFPNQCEEGKAKLEQHRKISSEFGITGTPTFFLNGQKFIGADPKMYDIAGEAKETGISNETIESEVSEENIVNKE